MKLVDVKENSRASPVVAISVAIVAVAVFAIYYSGSTQGAVQSNSVTSETCGVYPQATLLNGVESAIPGSASLLSTSDNGTAMGPPFTNEGTPTVHTDNSHIKISLFQLAVGASGPGIAATVTNTGSQTLNLTDFRIFGMIGPNGSLAWTSVLQAGAIDTRTNPNMFGTCPGPEPPATTEQLLAPGHSFTMYITGTRSYLSHHINGFQAQVIYWIPGNPLQYSADTNLVWIE
jgi:hypothetical protein